MTDSALTTTGKPTLSRYARKCQERENGSRAPFEFVNGALFPPSRKPASGVPAGSKAKPVWAIVTVLNERRRFAFLRSEDGQRFFLSVAIYTHRFPSATIMVGMRLECLIESERPPEKLFPAVVQVISAQA